MYRKNDSGIRAIDLFAGVGGSSIGARRAGVRVVAAVDAWELAKRNYLENFQGVHYYHARCEDLEPTRMKKTVGRIQLLMASPECTNHTCAKGNAHRSEESKATAFQVTRFAETFKPRWLIVENVVHMKGWDRYGEWLQSLENLGYNIRTQTINAADFGVPQSRRRLFVLGDLRRTPPEIVPPQRKRLNARFVINPNGVYKFTNLRTPNRARATLERAKRAMAVLGTGKPFLLVYYGTDGCGGWQRVDRPLRTITTVDRFAYVRPWKHGHEVRMLQVPELRKAMGFPADFALQHGTRREQIKLLGNAVCPPVIAYLIRRLTER